MKEFDVAVVGAGPAGWSPAIFLAQRGFQVALIDRTVIPRDKLSGCHYQEGVKRQSFSIHRAPAFGNEFRRRSSFSG